MLNLRNSLPLTPALSPGGAREDRETKLFDGLGNDFGNSPSFEFAYGARAGDFNRVAHFGLVALVVRVEPGVPAQNLGVLGMIDSPFRLHYAALIAFVRNHYAGQHFPQGTFIFLIFHFCLLFRRFLLAD